MSKRTKTLIMFIVGVQLVLIIGLLALPNVVGAIPGRYRVWLQENQPALASVTEGVIDQVAPVATALPAPAAGASNSVDITSLIAAEPQNIVASAGSSETNSEAIAPIITAQPFPTTIPDTIPEPLVEAAAPQPTLEPTAEPTQAPTPTPAPLPSQAILADMGIVKQSFNNCGPANLTQVLNWYGSDITQEDVAAYLKPNPEDRNVSAWQIADYVNEYMPGYQALARSGGDLEMIKRFVAAGYPGGRRKRL